jgi:hypothetical protein
VFVCRATGKTQRQWLFDTPQSLARILATDIAQLTQAGRAPTRGDIRCIASGHLTRMAIWNLRQDWEPDRPMREKLARFAEGVFRLGSVEEILGLLDEEKLAENAPPLYVVATPSMGEALDAVSF